MEEHIVHNEFIISTEPKTFFFDLSAETNNNFNQEIYSIINHKEP